MKKLKKYKSMMTISGLVNEPRLVWLDKLILEFDVKIYFLFIVKSPEDFHGPIRHEKCIFDFFAEKPEADGIVLQIHQSTLKLF